MKITREVVTDMFPLYLSGEASADTRALVEEFLREDPEFAGLIRLQSEQSLFSKQPQTPLPADHEVNVVQRTRRRLRWRSWWLALSLTFTSLPLSFAYDISRGELIWFMLRDAPGMAWACWTAALNCWIFYVFTWRRLRSSGL